MFAPLFLNLEGKPVLVVGGGEIAARKAAELVRVGAQVTLVAPEARDVVGASVVQRMFEDSDVIGTWLVVAATDDARVQARVAECAQRERVFVIAVDDLANASAISPAVVRRGPVTVAISSGGEAPALTRLLREIIEQILPEDRWIAAARELRVRWKRQREPMESRFGELVASFAARRKRDDVAHEQQSG